MGFFSKETCIICGEETGSLNKTKLNNNSYICSSCLKRVGISKGFTLTMLKGLNVNEIKDRITYHENDKKENEDRLKKFVISTKVGNYIWFDDKNNWFVYPKVTLGASIDGCYIFKYEDILDYEVLEDGTTVTKGGLGKAIVGGALFGLAGAIVGGTSKKAKNVCDKLEIKITTKNPDYPISYIKLINSQVPKKGIIYKTAFNKVQEILSKFQIIVDKIENERNIQKNNISSADEIKKYKELLDIGAITQEEFDVKKKELLKL